MFDCRNTLNNLATFAFLRGRSIFSRTLGHRGKTFAVQKESGHQNQRLDVWLLGVRWVSDWSSCCTKPNPDRCNRWDDRNTDEAWNALLLFQRHKNVLISAEPTFISASWVERKNDSDNEKIYIFFREKNSDTNPEADPWISRVARVCKVSCIPEEASFIPLRD